MISSEDSETSSDDEDEIYEDETLADRLFALRDMISPQTRYYISNKFEKTSNFIKSGLFFSGRTIWVISTSVLLLGVPWALAFAEEQQMIEMEKEMKMREMGGEVCSIPSIILINRNFNHSKLLSAGTTTNAAKDQTNGQQGKPAL